MLHRKHQVERLNSVIVIGVTEGGRGVVGGADGIKAPEKKIFKLRCFSIKGQYLNHF